MTTRRSFLIGAAAMMVTPFAVKPPREDDYDVEILEGMNEIWSSGFNLPRVIRVMDLALPALAG